MGRLRLVFFKTLYRLTHLKWTLKTSFLAGQVLDIDWSGESNLNLLVTQCCYILTDWPLIDYTGTPPPSPPEFTLIHLQIDLGRFRFFIARDQGRNESIAPKRWRPQLRILGNKMTFFLATFIASCLTTMTSSCFGGGSSSPDPVRKYLKVAEDAQANRLMWV